MLRSNCVDVDWRGNGRERRWKFWKRLKVDILGGSIVSPAFYCGGSN